jgi:arylsulfatase A-like enzyme
MTSGSKKKRPNIIFIMADDLGLGNLGCYGGTKILTPSVDRMAREGLRFTEVYAGHCVCAFAQRPYDWPAYRSHACA